MAKRKISDEILIKNGFVELDIEEGKKLFLIRGNGIKLDVVKTTENEYYYPNVGISFKIYYPSEINTMYKSITGKDMEY